MRWVHCWASAVAGVAEEAVTGFVGVAEVWMLADGGGILEVDAVPVAANLPAFAFANVLTLEAGLLLPLRTGFGGKTGEGGMGGGVVEAVAAVFLGNCALGGMGGGVEALVNVVVVLVDVVAGATTLFLGNSGDGGLGASRLRCIHSCAKLLLASDGGSVAACDAPLTVLLVVWLVEGVDVFLLEVLPATLAWWVVRTALTCVCVNFVGCGGMKLTPFSAFLMTVCPGLFCDMSEMVSTGLGVNGLKSLGGCELPLRGG